MRTTHRRLVLLLVSAVLVLAGGVGLSTAHAAASGCKADYKITNSWSTGFGADVTVTNLGDPLTSWTLTWSFAAGQAITQAWNATVTTSGGQVSARNAVYNGSIASGGTAAFGFNGTHSGTNPVPSTFALNGVTCTGGPASTGPTTAGPTVTPCAGPTTPPATSSTPVPPAQRIKVWLEIGRAHV